MKWALSSLHRYHDEPLRIDETIDLNAAMTKAFPDQVLSVEPVKVKGYLTYDSGDATVSVKVVTTITVPSSRSLTPVPLSLNFPITESYTDDRSHLSRYEKDDMVFLLPEDDDTIDFDSAVAQNIIEQIPLQVLSDSEKAGAAMPKGKDWEVISEDDFEAQKQADKTVDPRLAKLKNLFPDQDEKK